MKRLTPRGQKSRRIRRVASLIRQIVSETLVTELSDPRVAFLTVTGVDVSADMRVADVRVSVLGDAKAQEACLKAVRHAHGRLQQRVADSLDMKYCPVLKFHLDDSVKRSVSLSAAIAQARAEDEAARADRIRRGVEPEPLPDDDDAAPAATGPADEPDGADTPAP